MALGLTRHRGTVVSVFETTAGYSGQLALP